MIPWSVDEPALKALVSRLSGLTQVLFEDEPRPTRNRKQMACGLLSIFGVNGKGQTASSVISEAVDGDGGLGFETIVSYQQITLRVKVETYDQRAGRTARQYLEAMRPAWQWKSTTAALVALGLGFIDIATLQDLSETRDQQIESIAILDVRLSCSTLATDPEGYSWIEHVNTSYLWPAVGTAQATTTATGTLS